MLHQAGGPASGRRRSVPATPAFARLLRCCPVPRGPIAPRSPLFLLLFSFIFFSFWFQFLKHFLFSFLFVAVAQSTRAGTMGQATTKLVLINETPWPATVVARVPVTGEFSCGVNPGTQVRTQEEERRRRKKKKEEERRRSRTRRRTRTRTSSSSSTTTTTKESSSSSKEKTGGSVVHKVVLGQAAVV